MKKFFESQTAANGKRKSPFKGIVLLLIGAFLGGAFVQTGSVWATDPGISYSQKKDQLNQQTVKGPQPLVLVPRNKNTLRSQTDLNNVDRSVSENRTQEHRFSFLSDILHHKTKRENTASQGMAQQMKNSNTANASVSASQKTMTPTRQVPTPQAVSAGKQAEQHQSGLAQNSRNENRIENRKESSVRKEANQNAFASENRNSYDAVHRSVQTGTMSQKINSATNQEVRESRKSEFGVIRPVADIVSREETTSFSGKTGSVGVSQPESAHAMEPAAGRRVINSYAGGSVGDTIEDLESPYAPVRKSKSMKVEAGTDNLLLDSDFSVDELLAEDKTKDQIGNKEQKSSVANSEEEDSEVSQRSSVRSQKTFKADDQEEADEDLAEGNAAKRRSSGEGSEIRKHAGSKLNADKISGQRASDRKEARNDAEESDVRQKADSVTENITSERSAAPVMMMPGSPLLMGNASLPINKGSDAESISSNKDQTVAANNEKSQTAELFDSTKKEENGEMVLASRQSPVIDIRTIGPKRIIVGHESLYQIRVRNVSSVEARKLIITTDIPASVEVVDAQTTIGNTNLLPIDTISQKQQNHWQLETLAPGSEEILSLTLIPKQRNNFNLDCRYDFEQTSFQAGIEVQEAVLELQIEGRDAIEWGVEDKYRLRLRNTGNGDAENVRLLVSTGDNEQATQILNLLKAGEEKVMDLSVRTMLDKEIVLGAEASNGPGLTARVNKSVKILRGHLRIAAEAPELQFVNNRADYVIRIKNDGTAPLKNVDISAVLSEGCRFVSCTGSGQEIPGRSQILWKIPILAVGEEVVYQVVGQMVRSGMNRIDVTAADKSGLSAVCGAMTKVDAIASLNMRIKAPNGPVAVGSPVYYEVTIANNGTRAAENVNAGVMFVEGIKALEVEGGQGRIKAENAKVFFNPIRILSAGQTISWRIKAQPVQRGSHKVIAVVESAADNIRLNNEEVTYCYDRQGGAENVPSVQQTAKTSRPGTDLFGDAVDAPAVMNQISTAANATPMLSAPTAANVAQMLPAPTTANATPMLPAPTTANATPMLPAPTTANAAPMLPAPTAANAAPMLPAPTTANAAPMLPAPIAANAAPAVASVPPLDIPANETKSFAPASESSLVKVGTSLNAPYPVMPSGQMVSNTSAPADSAVANQTSVELKPATVSPTAANAAPMLPAPTAASASALEKSETSLLKCGPIPYTDTETQKRY